MTPTDIRDSTVPAEPPVAVRRRCRHLRLTHCPKCTAERRRVQREADEAVGHARTDVPPQTYDLDERELRAEANRLHRDGWPVDEVLLVLDLQPAEQVAS